MREPSAPLHVWVELTDDRRLLPRILTLVTGRAFSINRSDYQRTAPGRGSLLLDLNGPSEFHHNLVCRIRQSVGVLDATVMRPGLPAEGLEGDRIFSVPRARVNTRVDGGEVITHATIALATGKSSFLAAGEGCGAVEALARAFEVGLSQLFPSALDGIMIDRVFLSVRDTHDGLGARVEVGVSASNRSRTWHAVAVTTDVAQAGVEALTQLYGTVLADRRRARATS